MAKALITLTPTHSKKFIAMAVSRMEVVRKAFREGMIVLHPSSSTYFIVEELIGEKPPTNYWVCGMIVPKGLCLEMGVKFPSRFVSPSPEASIIMGPEEFDRSWAIKGGKLFTGIKLKQLIEEMGKGDVYIKGPNALSPQGKVGVLIGNAIEGGTIGRVMTGMKRRGYEVIFPTGLEKLIPTPIEEAAKEAKKSGYKYSLGITCGLLPCEGTVITEIEAFKILSGCRAIPVAAGGLGGGEGSTILVVEGEDAKLEQAMNYVKLAKEAKLPEVRAFHCSDCPVSICPGIRMP